MARDSKSLDTLQTAPFLDRDRQILTLQQQGIAIQRLIDRLMAERDEQVLGFERQVKHKVLDTLQGVVQGSDHGAAWYPSANGFDAKVVTRNGITIRVGCDVSLPQPGRRSIFVRIERKGVVQSLEVGHLLNDPEGLVKALQDFVTPDPQATSKPRVVGN
jgi:hypothetical protein